MKEMYKKIIKIIKKYDKIVLARHIFFNYKLFFVKYLFKNKVNKKNEYNNNF